MASRNLKRARAVPTFANTFVTALRQFSDAFFETAGVGHTTVKGTLRENALGEYLTRRLPSVYSVASGVAVDLLNNQSPQLDVMIYDQSENFPFQAGGNTVILPAEALLASVEVKSQLNSAEVAKCVAAAHRLRELRPFNKPLGGEDIGDPARSRSQARYFHCVFAMSSDLNPDTWAGTEYGRFERSEEAQSHNVDLVYVLDRGLINIRERKALPENRETGQAFLSFYFSILNFVDRENGRRGPTPYASYAAKIGGKWISV
jgi:hypothetical protein